MTGASGITGGNTGRSTGYGWKPGGMPANGAIGGCAVGKLYLIAVSASSVEGLEGVVGRRPRSFSSDTFLQVNSIDAYPASHDPIAQSLHKHV